MKKAKAHSYFMVIVLIGCFHSCSNYSHSKKEKSTTPQVLQDHASEIKSSRYSNDLVEELYAEIRNINPNLIKLEKDIDAHQENSNDFNNTFTEYNSKSESYYNQANYKSKAIKDSTLKHHLLGLIDESKVLYTNKVSKLNNLIKSLEQSKGDLSDRQLALKIILTIPALESFQENELPDKVQFAKLLNELKSLIARADSLGSIKN